MRLNGWQRIGVVVSLAWAVGAAIYQRNADVERAENFAAFSNRVCVANIALLHDNDLASCEQEREKNLGIWLKGSWGNVAFMALVPIPLGWLAAFILINAGRAQIIGFRAVVPWATLDRREKIFVVFCALVSGGVALLCVVVLLNLYVDSKVPVVVGASAMVTKTGDDFVSVEGTWTRSGSAAGSAMGYPLQTSRIQCHAWKFQLVDGFRVYWEQRQKARPLPLRLVQSFF